MSKDKASQKINSKITGTSKRRGFVPVLIIILALIAVMVVGVIVITFVGKESKGNVVVTPDNVQQIIDEIQAEERTPVGSYRATMNSNWHFKDDDSASYDAYVENSVYNQNTVYFTIALEGTDEDIYKSPYIPVGSKLKEITLGSSLGKGTHKAVLTYHLVDTSYKEVGSVSVSITLTIEK